MIMRTQRRNSKKTMMGTTAANDKDNANAEWTASVSCYEVPTATAAPTPTQVDVDKSISEQDLKSLKKQDPFLYYSIPGVRDATVRLKRTDDMHQIVQNGLRRCQSCPESSKASSGTPRRSEPPAPVAKVQRRTRLSFERHPDLLWDGTDDIADMGNPQEGLSVESLDDPISGLVPLFTS